LILTLESMYYDLNIQFSDARAYSTDPVLS